jgi:hypothetical protein
VIIMNVNTSNYSRRAIDPNILSVLDVTANGKVVSAEDWKLLWTTVFNHINGLSEYVTTLDVLQSNWESSMQALDTTIKDFNIKYSAVAQSFIHYGAQAPSNPNIRLWVQPTHNVNPKLLLTRAELAELLRPKADVNYVNTAIQEALASLQPATRLTTVSLPASGWVGTASPYKQVINIAGVTSNSKIDLNPTIDQLAIFHTKDISFVVENNNKIITVYCLGQKPTNDYTIQATITEVVSNG